MSASQRNKGARGELEVVDLLTSYGYPAARAFASGGGKGGGGDIVGGPDGYLIEVKRTNRWQPWAAIDQACEACRPGQIPLVLVRPDRRDWHAFLPAAALLDVIARTA
jgi:Holliday junction resolvase